MKPWGQLAAEWQSAWENPRTYSTWTKPQHWWVRVEVSNDWGTNTTTFTVAREKVHLFDLLGLMLEQVRSAQVELLEDTGESESCSEFQVYRIKPKKFTSGG